MDTTAGDANNDENVFAIRVKGFDATTGPPWGSPPPDHEPRQQNSAFFVSDHCTDAGLSFVTIGGAVFGLGQRMEQHLMEFCVLCVTLVALTWRQC